MSYPARAFVDDVFARLVPKVGKQWLAIKVISTEDVRVILRRAGQNSLLSILVAFRRAHCDYCTCMHVDSFSASPPASNTLLR